MYLTVKAMDLSYKYEQLKLLLADQFTDDKMAAVKQEPDQSLTLFTSRSCSLCWRLYTHQILNRELYLLWNCEGFCVPCKRSGK